MRDDIVDYGDGGTMPHATHDANHNRTTYFASDWTPGAYEQFEQVLHNSGLWIATVDTNAEPSLESGQTDWRLQGYNYVGIGSMDIADPPTLAGDAIGAGWTHLDDANQVVVDGYNCDLDPFNSTFSFSLPGLWELAFSLAFGNDNQQAGRITNLRVWNETKQEEIGRVGIGIGRNTEYSSTFVRPWLRISPAYIGDVIRWELGGGDSVTIDYYDAQTTQLHLLTPFGAPVFNPPSVPGLVAWYDPSSLALATGVTTITDQSGSGWDLSGNCNIVDPAANGVHFLQCPGTNTMRNDAVASVFAGTDNDWTVISVHRTIDTAGNQTMWSAGSSVSNGIYISDGYDAAGDYQTNLGGGAVGYTGSPVIANQTRVSTLRKKAGNVADKWIDTTEEFLAQPAPDQATDQFGLCALFRTTNVNNYAGHVGEVLIYDRAIDDAELADIYTYLAGKWTA